MNLLKDGKSGMGQAQSQSMGVDCSECSENSGSQNLNLCCLKNVVEVGLF